MKFEKVTNKNCLAIIDGFLSEYDFNKGLSADELEAFKKAGDDGSITKLLILKRAERSLDIIDSCAESPIEKVFGKSFFTAFFIFSPYAVTVPIDFKKYSEEIKKSAKTKKHKMFCDNMIELESALFENTTFYIFPNNYADENNTIRPDFQLVHRKTGERIVIECDGFAWHGDKKAFEKDKVRERKLTELGISVLRVSGGEIYRDPVETALNILGSVNKILENKYGKIQKG